VTTTRRDAPPLADTFPPAGTFSGLGETGANNFDVLRFVLASLVILSHSFPLLHGDNRREPLSRLTGGQTDLGTLAVDGFFLISGFLISRSWLRSAGTADYLKKRILRIYPGFLVAAAFGAFAVGPLLAVRPSAYWSRFSAVTFGRSALALQAVYPRVFGALPYPSLNGSLWTVGYEFECYLAVILLGRLGFWRSRSGPAVGLALAVGLYAAQAHWPGPGQAAPFGRGPWPRFAATFLAGVWFQSERERLPRSSGLFVAALWGLVVLAAVPEWRGFAPAVPVLGGYMLFYLASLPTPWSRRRARRADISYGLYLYAFPVQQLLVRYLGADRLTPLGLFALAYPAALVMAVLSWRLVEAPCLRRKVRPAPGPPVPTARQAEPPHPAHDGLRASLTASPSPRGPISSG